MNEPGTRTDTASNNGSAANPIEVLLHLARRARHAASAAELGFIVANETHALAPYRQAVLWFAERGVCAISGVVAPEANAPFVHWLDRVATRLGGSDALQPLVLTPAHLAPGDADEWGEWLPEHALWFPLSLPGQAGGLLFARETPWQTDEVNLLGEWLDIWYHAWQGKHRTNRFDRVLRILQRPHDDAGQPPAASLRERWQAWFARSRQWTPKEWPRAIWQSPRKRYTALACLCLLIPVRLPVLVPGELVPAQPAAIRAPLDGTVDRFFITPNQQVKAGAPLFQLDLTTLSSKHDVAKQALSTAEAEYRQAAQQAVFDERSKAQLAALQGRIAERRTEAEYLQAQLARAQVTAPTDGIALVDDPAEWIGRPVMTGERVMTIADEHDVEVEAWLAPADVIDLPERSAVTLYLNSMPLSPVHAQLRYAAHEATQRPDGSFAYRVRASLSTDEFHPRVGLKGSARVAGHYVPLVYWVLRRPLAVVRPWLGL